MDKRSFLDVADLVDQFQLLFVPRERCPPEVLFDPKRYLALVTSCIDLYITGLKRKERESKYFPRRLSCDLFCWYCSADLFTVHLSDVWYTYSSYYGHDNMISNYLVFIINLFTYKCTVCYYLLGFVSDQTCVWESHLNGKVNNRGLFKKFLWIIGCFY